MEDVKKVIGVLLQEFAKEEAGNRVTSNNMAGLQMKIQMAFDGKIHINPPPAATEPVAEEQPSTAVPAAVKSDLH